MKQGLGTFTRYKWTGVIAFSLMYVFVYLGRFNMSYLMGRISEDVIISAGQQQLITISILFSYALGSFINGYLADLYGAKKIIVLGGIMTCVLNMCVAVINSGSISFSLYIVFIKSNTSLNFSSVQEYFHSPDSSS